MSLPYPFINIPTHIPSPFFKADAGMVLQIWARWL